MSSRRSSSFMVLGLIARSDLPCVEMSAATPFMSKSYTAKWEYSTYFCCTVAPGGNCGVHAHVARPCGAWLAASALPHLVLVGAAGLRRSFGGSSQSGAGSDRSRLQNGAAVAFRSYGGL